MLKQAAIVSALLLEDSHFRFKNSKVKNIVD